MIERQAQGYAGAQCESRRPTLTVIIDRIEKTLFAAHERADTAAGAVTRLSYGDVPPSSLVGRDEKAVLTAPTVEVRLNEVVGSADALLAKIESIAKRLNALV